MVVGAGNQEALLRLKDERTRHDAVTTVEHLKYVSILASVVMRHNQSMCSLLFKYKGHVSIQCQLMEYSPARTRTNTTFFS